MMIFEVQELTHLFSTYKGAGADKIAVDSIMTDTRKSAPQSLFVPIVGESFDAHQFAGEAIKQGAVAALWQEDQPLPVLIPTDFPVFFVKDTTKALQDLASWYLKKVDPIVVGITGSNGKTTTKDMTASVLAAKFKTHKTGGNFNNHIGLPLTVLSMLPDTEAVVLEMGMDRAGEISVLSHIAQPDHAIITNIGESHIENLGTREAIAAAKLEITDGLADEGCLIIDADEPLLDHVKTRAGTIGCGFGSSCDYKAEITGMTDENFTFRLMEEDYELPMTGRHNVKNASFVIALAKRLGMTKEEIQQGFRQMQMSAMRFEKHEGYQGSLIINDAYNASPTSMKAMIEVIRQLTSKTKKVLILGDMYELGGKSEELHAGVAEAVDEKIDAVFTIGVHSEKISEAASSRYPDMEVKHFKEKQQASHHIRPLLTADTVVLMKASRGMKLEDMLPDLVK